MATAQAPGGLGYTLGAFKWILRGLLFSVIGFGIGAGILAVVRTAALPLLGADGDQGPDDLLVRDGAQAFRDLVDAALPGDPLQRIRAATELPHSERGVGVGRRAGVRSQR